MLFLVLAIALGDGLVSNTIKKLVARPRPCIALADTQCRIGSTTSGSMPSSHASNWFGATMVCFLFYRRRRGVVATVAIVGGAVAFSRVYDGVHYSERCDRRGHTWGGMRGGHGLGRGISLGPARRKWFPLWWAQMPSCGSIGEVRAGIAPDSPQTDEITARSARLPADDSTDGICPTTAETIFVRAGPKEIPRPRPWPPRNPAPSMAPAITSLG